MCNKKSLESSEISQQDLAYTGKHPWGFSWESVAGERAEGKHLEKPLLEVLCAQKDSVMGHSPSSLRLLSFDPR